MKTARWAVEFRYTRAADTLYVDLDGDSPISTTKQVTKQVAVHFGDMGQPVGIEIGYASRVYGKEILDRVWLSSRLLTLAEAAMQSGLREDSLKKLLQKGLLPGTKNGRSWIINQMDLLTYFEARGAKSRDRAREMQERIVRNLSR